MLCIPGCYSPTHCLRLLQISLYLQHLLGSRLLYRDRCAVALSCWVTPTGNEEAKASCIVKLYLCSWFTAPKCPTWESLQAIQSGWVWADAAGESCREEWARAQLSKDFVKGMALWGFGTSHPFTVAPRAWSAVSALNLVCQAWVPALMRIYFSVLLPTSVQILAETGK